MILTRNISSGMYFAIVSLNRTMARILVLDDEKLIRWSLDHILRQEGHDVDVAATPDEAGRLAAANTYHLILADLEVCRDRAKPFFDGLSKDQAGAKVIIITALPLELAEKVLGDFKAFRIVEKPFASEQIRSLVKDALI
jgi:two-component system response regulator AtoC